MASSDQVMKITMILIVFLLAPGAVHAQTFKEWFRQKKTQKQYLIEQIAQYRVYLELLEKGYKITKQGLETVHDIKNGEFKLHKNYIDSLRIVGTQVSSYKKIKLIEVLYAEIKAVTATSENRLAGSGYLNGQELGYARSVYSRLLVDSHQIRDALKDVTRDGPLSMSDNQRFKRIDLLLDQMEANYSFAIAFSREAMVLAASRLREADDIKTRRAINDAH